jgi:hypothetical protein
MMECEYFGVKAILFVAVSDSPVARNLFGQSKKLGCRFSHCFRETDSVFEQVMKNSVHVTSMLHSNETPISEYKGSIQWKH